MWQVGQRVLARRRPEVHWYPAMIRAAEDTRYQVQFEDGDEGFATLAELTGSQFRAGDRVEVYQAAASNFLPAQVTAVGDDSLQVRYMNREEQWVPLSKIRIHPENWRQPEPDATPAEERAWSVCDRVLACWLDLDWYPGIVLEAQPGRLHVLLDQGAQALLPANKVRPFHLAPGERVLSRRRGGKDFYTGQLTDVDGEKVQILYDDGKQETTAARLLRLRRDEWLPEVSANGPKEGARVLAQWFDLFWYPGIVRAVEGKRVHVSLVSGNQIVVAADQVVPFDLAAGRRVYCRRGGGQQFVPVEVKGREGPRIRVTYEDGGEEWTSVRMLRFER